MPSYEINLPIDASNIKAVNKGHEYPIQNANLITRTGEGGDTQILTLYGGDEFNGAILEGTWVKYWDLQMWLSGVPATAVLDGSGLLEFTGGTPADNTNAYGYARSTASPLITMHETEVTVSMQVPVDDTTNDEIRFDFFLTDSIGSSNPRTQDGLNFRISVTPSGLLLLIYLNYSTLLFDGSTYDDTSVRATGEDLKGAVWRMVFHEADPNGSGNNTVKHMHVYLRQGATIAEAETNEETELSSSPFDISDLPDNTLYPAFLIGTEDDDYFITDKPATSYIKVDYPNFRLVYDVDDDDRLTDEVEIWDGDPDSGGSKVYDIDHVFSGDVYLQNGFNRYLVDIGAINGLKVYSYINSVWTRYTGTHYVHQDDSAQNLYYPYIVKIVELTPETATIRVKLCEDAVDDDDYYVLFDITMERGNRIIKVKAVDVYPSQSFDYYLRAYGSVTDSRFGYAGNGEIGDDDVNETGTNSTLSDNIMVMFDNEGTALVWAGGSNKKPGSFQVTDGKYMAWIDVLPEDLGVMEFYYGVLPFAKVANMFKEAEDGSYPPAPGTVYSGSVVADGTASGGQVVQLDALAEQVFYYIDPYTDIRQGRYLAVVRAKDTNQVANDLLFVVFNNDLLIYRNETAQSEYFTLTADWAYYSMVFDVLDSEQSDSWYIGLGKDTVTANTISIDYFLIIPLGNGESFPMDYIYNQLREVKQERRLFNR